MAEFVLIHGAWHGGWCWEKVRSQLWNAGHRVYTPTLAGLCERRGELTPDVRLETHVDDICTVLRAARLRDAILVAHSYGGMIAQQAASRLPGAVAHIVYLDAFVPEHGRSLNSYMPDGGARFRAAAANGDGWTLPPIPAASFNVNALDRAWVDAACSPHPAGTFEEPADLSGVRRPIPSTYILAEDNPISPFYPTAEKAAADGWACHRLAGGHDLMLDNPDDLCRILLEIAGDETRETFLHSSCQGVLPILR